MWPRVTRGPGGVVNKVPSIQIYIDSATLVAWCAGSATRLRTCRCGIHLWRGQRLLRLEVQPDLDAIPHGATGSNEDELEAADHLLLLPGINIAAVSQDGDEKR